MPLADTASLEGLSLAELRDLIGVLVAEVRRLQSDNAALRAEVETQQATITALRAENQVLRDEVARLKGLPPRPPSRPSGMEQARGPGMAGKSETRSRRGRGAKRDRNAITVERALRAAVPAGSRFKGYEDCLVRDLCLSAEVIRYRRERWLTPAGETVVAPLPAGIVGGFGPELRRFVLALHALLDSHIYGTICQAPAKHDLVKLDQTMMHGLWPWRPVSARDVAGPSTKASHDPSVPREKARIMRVPEFRGASFQSGVEFAQCRHLRRIDRVGDRLPGRAVAGQHKLHRAHCGDQRNHRQFGERTDLFHLRILDAQAVRFQ
jgi:uncharacterized small protein (DUF1192 family)